MSGHIPNDYAFSGGPCFGLCRARAISTGHIVVPSHHVVLAKLILGAIMIAIRTVFARPVFARPAFARPACASVAMALLLTPASAFDLDAAALAKLSAGETVTKFTADKSQSAAGLLEAVIDIPAPREAVWKVLTDCEGSVKVFSGLKTCKIVKTEPGGKADVREHVISWHAMLPSVRSVFRSQYDAPNRIAFVRTEGDLKELKGEWIVQALPDGKTTRLTYAAHIALGIPVPSPLVRTVLEGDMPKSMKAIRRAASGK